MPPPTRKHGDPRTPSLLSLLHAPRRHRLWIGSRNQPPLLADRSRGPGGNVAASSTNAGVDLRFVRGEAREEFAFAENAFTRGLLAGGDQGNVGIFLLRDQEFSSTFRALLGARVDAWNEGGGHEEVTDLESGEIIGAVVPNASGTEFSPSAGLVWRPSGDWRLHVNAQQSFSRPTLSEMYQPYGLDSVVTQSNPL